MISVVLGSRLHFFTVMIIGIEAAAMGMMDPKFMQEALEMMKDPEVVKQVTKRKKTPWQ